MSGRETTTTVRAGPEAEVLLVGVSVRPFAQSAVRAGADAASVDCFGDRDHRRDLPVLSLRREAPGEAYSAAALVRMARRVRVGEVAYGADLENHPREVDRLAATDGRRLLGNPPAVLRRARDPFRLAALLREEELPAPEVRPPAGAPEPAAEAGGWLRKPRGGGGGHGVRVWRAEEDLADGEYLQERVRGTPVGVLFVADGRRARLLAVTEMLVGRRAFGASRFLYVGSLLRRGRGGRPLPPPGAGRPGGRSPARRLVSVLARDLELRGLNGVDAVLKDGELWPVEVNPRWTASMELLEAGVLAGGRRLPRPLFELHRRACRGDLPARDELPGGGPGGPGEEVAEVVGKAVVRSRGEGPVVDLTRLEEVRTVLGADAPAVPLGGVALADVPEPGDPLNEGDPVCTLVAAGEDRSECVAVLERGCRGVHRALACEG